MKLLHAALIGIALSITPVLSTNALELGWSFNRATNGIGGTNGTFTFSYPAQSNHVYGLVRYDIAHDYYDQPHFFDCSNSVQMSFDLDPMISGGEDLNPNPSGVFWFYLYDLTFEQFLENPGMGMQSAQCARETSIQSASSPVMVRGHLNPPTPPAFLHPAFRSQTPGP